MKNKVFKYILVLVAGLIIINLAQAQNYQTDATYLKLVKEYRLNPDGSFDYNCSKQLKLNSYYSFHRLYGETFIVYNPKYQELKINEAFTIMADGKKVITPENAFNEVLPRYAANAPAYNHLREMVVTHTGLERNAVINLDYTIHSSGEFLPDFFGKELFNQSSPVKEMIFRIKVPADKVLQYKTLNIRTAPEVTDNKGQKVYTWKFKNLEARSHDPSRPADDIYLPGVIFSTAKDLHRVYDKFTNSKSFYVICNDDMTAVVDNLVATKKSQTEIALDLQELVVNEINFWNIPLEKTAFNCRKAIETWNSNGGTAIEKTMLLYNLLIKSEIHAMPVAVIPENFYDPSIGCLNTFEDFLIQVNPDKGDQFYISATQLNKQNLIYGLEGKTLLAVDPAIESLKTYSYEPVENNVEFECELFVEDIDRISGEAEIELTGNSNPYIKLFKNNENAKKIISPLKVKDFDIKKQKMDVSRIEYLVEANNIFKKHGDYYFLNIPQIRAGSGNWYLPLLTENRSAKIEIANIINETYEYSFEINNGFSVVTPADKLEIINDLGSVYLEVIKDKNELTFLRKIKLNKKIINLNEYEDFKELIKGWKSKKFKQLIIKK